MQYVLNQHGHYFAINTDEVEVSKDQLQSCRFFDDEKQLLQAVCKESQCDLEEVEGSTFYIAKRNGSPVMIDDRGFPHEIDGPVEQFLANFQL